MDDWLNRYADALRTELHAGEDFEEEWPEPAEPGGEVAPWAASPVDPPVIGALAPPGLDDGVVEVLLELARAVAHGTQRRNAPLATFLAGRFVAARIARGGDELTAAEEAKLVALRLLPP